MDNIYYIQRYILKNTLIIAKYISGLTTIVSVPFLPHAQNMQELHVNMFKLYILTLIIAKYISGLTTVVSVPFLPHARATCRNFQINLFFLNYFIVSDVIDISMPSSSLKLKVPFTVFTFIFFQLLAESQI